MKHRWKKTPPRIRLAVIISAVILVVAFIAVLGRMVSELLAPRAVSIRGLRLATAGPQTALDLMLWNETKAPQSLTSLNLELTVENLPPSAGPEGLHVFGARGTMAVSTEGKGPISGDTHSLGRNQAGSSATYPFAGSMIVMGEDRWVLALTLPLREQIGPGERLALGVALPETIKITGSALAAQVQPWMKEYASGDLPGDFHLVPFLQKSGQADAYIGIRYAERNVTGYHGSLKFRANAGGEGH